MPALVRRARAAIALALGALVVAAGGVAWRAAAQAASDKSAAPESAKPALTVTVATPQPAEWPRTLEAQGNIAAWQEAVIGAELAGFRVTEVLINVGDLVKKGQTLARISAETVAADVAQARAAVAEAEAALAEARSNAARTRDLQARGFVSPQAGTQIATGEQTAAARLAAARARLRSEEVRQAQTRVVAPDDGVISARGAAVGSLTQPGQELFRLIRGNRLEWRAEVGAADLGRLKPGVPATVRLPGGAEVGGRVRIVAPTVDPQTRNAIVYVDLPPAAPDNPARAGMFARGEFELGRAAALTVPQAAVVLRDGFSYVYTIDESNRVARTKVEVGRRNGERIEVLAGLSPRARIVAAGAAFLADGDRVRVVDAAAAPAAKSAAGQ